MTTIREGDITVQAGPTPIVTIEQSPGSETDAVEQLRSALIDVATIEPNSVSRARRAELRRALVEVRPRIDDLIRWLAAEGA